MRAIEAGLLPVDCSEASQTSVDGAPGLFRWQACPYRRGTVADLVSNRQSMQTGALPLSNIVTAAPQRWVLGYERFPQLLAARARFSRSRPIACSSSAARSARSINAWVGRTHAVGHRVIPLVRMNSATASVSSLDIVPPSPASSSTPVGGG
jgi:hypothetical protein